MIKLIKDFAFKALKNPANPFPETGAVGDIHCFDDEELAKFAELIVRECAKFLEENSGYDQCNNAWHPEPEDLLEHFGVE